MKALWQKFTSQTLAYLLVSSKFLFHISHISFPISIINILMLKCYILICRIKVWRDVQLPARLHLICSIPHVPGLIYYLKWKFVYYGSSHIYKDILTKGHPSITATISRHKAIHLHCVTAHCVTCIKPNEYGILSG